MAPESKQYINTTKTLWFTQLHDQFGENRFKYIILNNNHINP